MKFSINRNSLVKNLAYVQRAIPSKTTIPILTGVKLEITTSELLLTGSDSNISIEKLITTDETDSNLIIEKTGSIVLASRFFSEIIRKLDGENVSIELVDNNKIEIKSNQSIFTINGIDPQLYPVIESLDTQTVQGITLPALLFKQVLQQTILAASNSEQRPILTGIHFKIANKELIATATDSHRMSRRIIPLDIDEKISLSCTIPAKSLSELSHIVSDEDTIHMYIFDNKVLFTAEKLIFNTRLLEGGYPDVSRLITNHNETTLKINAQKLLKAVERVSIVSSQSSSDFITLTIDKNALLSSNSTEIGYVEEELELITVIGKPIRISFNPNYMKDSLKVLGQSDINIFFIEKTKPFTLTLDNEQPDHFVQLITPVRTRD